MASDQWPAKTNVLAGRLVEVNKETAMQTNQNDVACRDSRGRCDHGQYWPIRLRRARSKREDTRSAVGYGRSRSDTGPTSAITSAAAMAGRTRPRPAAMTKAPGAGTTRVGSRAISIWVGGMARKTRAAPDPTGPTGRISTRKGNSLQLAAGFAANCRGVPIPALGLPIF